jgi:hypothetical protein
MRALAQLGRAAGAGDLADKALLASRKWKFRPNFWSWGLIMAVRFTLRALIICFSSTKLNQ